MRKITIAECAATDSGFDAELRFDNGQASALAITNPFTQKQEEELGWYLGEWPKFPFTDTAVARRAARSIRDCGVRLFAQIFSRADDLKKYAQLQERLDEVVIEVVAKSAGFQAVHWECLWDPDRPRPLAVDCSVVRKSCRPHARPPRLIPSPTLNILLVVARPGDEPDAGHFAISRPIVEAAATAKARVSVEVLRPATFEALSKKLKTRGPGYYHVVHFDCSGALMSYEEVCESGCLLRKRAGRRNLIGRKYKGLKSFLFLEAGAKADLVEASELAALLTGKNVSVCILNANQSGKQVREYGPGRVVPSARAAAQETSLGKALMAAGLRMCMAISQSIDVAAAGILMCTVYSQLFAQQPLLDAVRRGRVELHRRKRRVGSSGSHIDLEDWLSPVVYVNGGIDLQLCDFDLQLCDFDTPQEQEAYTERMRCRYRFEAPRFGFHGRDSDIPRIESALLGRNLMLLQGMGGAGKTTLLSYLREWWESTGFAQKTVYIDCHNSEMSLPQILLGVMQQIGDAREQRAFPTLSERAQLEKVVTKLRSKSNVMIMDSFESLATQKAAGSSSSLSDGCAKIHSFLLKLVGGQTRVVLSSRCNERWLADVLSKNVYRLHGLDPAAQTTLARKILEHSIKSDARIVEILRDSSFRVLMKSLAGYPLAMEVMLAHLPSQSPRNVLKRLDTGDISLDTSSEDRARSNLSCLEYSYRSLPDRSQQLLLCLWPFSNVLVRKTLHLFVKGLNATGSFQGIDVPGIDGAVRGAVEWGLLSSSGSSGPSDWDATVFTVHPMLPYFLKVKLGELDAGHQLALRTGFKGVYRDLSVVYGRLMESRDSLERRIGLHHCQLEYDHLYRALEMCLEDNEAVEISACLQEYLHIKSDFKTGLGLSKMVCEACKADMKKGVIGLKVVDAHGWLGFWHLKLNHYQEARDAYQKTVKLCKSVKGGDEKKVQSRLGVMYNQLGIVAHKMRDLDEACRHNEAALKIFVELDDRHSQAHIYHQLGIVAQQMGDHLKARQSYIKALNILDHFNDRCSQGSTFHQLGMVAQDLRDFDEASEFYQRALDIFVEFNDRRSQASTYHQLGFVAQECRDYDKACKMYQRALNIRIECDDRHSQAHTYYQLGGVAEALKDWDEARERYQRALEIYSAFDDRHSLSNTFNKLGTVAQEVNDLNAARQNYQQALNLFIKLGDRHSQASILSAMGEVAQELKEFGTAYQMHQRALNLYTEFGDRHSQASSYLAMGAAAKACMDFQQAWQNYQEALKIYIDFDDCSSEASTNHQLGRVAHELMDYNSARQFYQRALQIYVDFDDTHSQAGTLYQLGRLAQELEDVDEAYEHHQSALKIFIQCGDRRAQAETSLSLGLLDRAEGDFGGARAYLQQGLKIFQELKDADMVAWTARCLEDV